MSFLNLLKSVGKDLGHVGTWIEDGLKIVGPVAAQVATAVDPQVGVIITTVENVVAKIQATTPAVGMNAATLQAIVTAVTAAMKTAMPAAAPIPLNTPVPISSGGTTPGSQ